MPIRSKLKTQLVFRLIAVCVIISTAFLFVVSLIIRSQNLRISHELIVRAFNVIVDDIGATREKLLRDTLQFAEQKQVGSAVNLVRDYKSEASSSLYFTQDSYRRLAASVAGTGRTTGIMRMMVYDRDGDLAAFLRNDPSENSYGYAFGHPRPAFMINSSLAAQDASDSPWKRSEGFQGIAVHLASVLPTQPVTVYEVIDEVLCLVCYVPLFHSTFDRQSEQIISAQVGVAVTVHALGPSLEKRLSALTGTMVVMLPGYKEGTSSKIAPAMAWQEAPPSTPVRQPLETKSMLFNQVVVDGASYFQGILPLFEGNSQNAAISVRYSTAFASDNTRQMLAYMLIVSICCIIFIIPLALFFSNRIVQPVTALAETAQTIQQGDLNHRAHVHKDDEIGDLARAFNAMTDQLRASLDNLTQEKEALRKYERIVSSSLDLMALIDRRLVLEAVNESFANTFARQRDEVVGQDVAEVFGGPFFRQCLDPRLQKAFAGETIRFQEQMELAAGYQRLMEFALFPFVDEQGQVKGVVLNGRDITETRKLEEQLKQSQKIESIGTLAGGVAHEINNPINGIMNYAQLILDQSPPEAAAVPYAEEIIHETKRIAQIVRNLLTFARNEKQSHSPAQFEDIAAAVLSLIQTVMRRDQITLHIEIPPGLPKIKCRSQQIQQVLMNLLTNARDALNERYPGYHPEKQIRLSATRIAKGEKAYIRVTVEDCGIGIPSEIIEKIFDPFFTTKPKETGTGLGLSISYGIVRDHGGDLLVESEAGRFTRFFLDLPVNNGWTLPAREGDAHEPNPGS